MKTKLEKLIAERERLVSDLAISPKPVNHEGKELLEETPVYLLELDKKISRARNQG